MAIPATVSASDVPPAVRFLCDTCPDSMQEPVHIVNCNCQCMLDSDVREARESPCHPVLHDVNVHLHRNLLRAMRNSVNVARTPGNTSHTGMLSSLWDAGRAHSVVHLPFATAICPRRDDRAMQTATAETTRTCAGEAKRTNSAPETCRARARSTPVGTLIFAHQLCMRRICVPRRRALSLLPLDCVLRIRPPPPMRHIAVSWTSVRPQSRVLVQSPTCTFSACLDASHTSVRLSSQPVFVLFHLPALHSPPRLRVFSHSTGVGSACSTSHTMPSAR